MRLECPILLCAMGIPASTKTPKHSAKAVDTNLQAANAELSRQAARAQADLESIHAALSTKLSSQAKHIADLQQQLGAVQSQHETYKEQAEGVVQALQDKLAQHAQPVGMCVVNECTRCPTTLPTTVMALVKHTTDTHMYRGGRAACSTLSGT